MARAPDCRLLAPLAAALAALASCTSEPSSGEPRDPSAPVSSASPALAPPASGAVTAADEIFGQWRLAALSGAPARDHEIHLLIGRLGIEAVSQCVPFGFRLPFPAAATPPPARPSDPPEPVCARGLSPAEQAFARTMEAAARVERRGGGRIAFVGPRGDAVLERPAAPVTNPFQNAPGPGPDLMWGEWRVEAVGGHALAGEPIRLLFGRRTVEAMSGCVAMLWRYRQDRDRLALEREGTVGGICERAESPEEAALRAALSGEVRIARSTPTERLLAGSGGTVSLRR